MPEDNLNATDTPLPPQPACDYLERVHGIRRSVRTLQVMRREGRGPAYRQNVNEIRYTKAALDAWVRELFANEYRNTTEAAARRLVTARSEG
jgi:hypothetical protein